MAVIAGALVSDLGVAEYQAALAEHLVQLRQGIVQRCACRFMRGGERQGGGLPGHLDVHADRTEIAGVEIQFDGLRSAMCQTDHVLRQFIAKGG